MLCQEAVMTLGCVPLARYATTGTQEVAESLGPHLAAHDAILLENHGVVSYGSTLLEGFMKMETVEHLAHAALVAHQLGSARPLLAEQVKKLQWAKQNTSTMPRVTLRLHMPPQIKFAGWFAEGVRYEPEA
jgi:L-fuculose-phosphate aldolase